MITPHVEYRDGSLFVEDVALSDIAKRYGTPTYVYSKAALWDNYAAYSNATRDRDALVCYAVKANSNLAILNQFASWGSGFDIVSGGELQRVLRAKGDPHRIIFSGVGKSRQEMRLALEHEIFCFNVESSSELRRLDAVAHECGRIAHVSLRINPDVDARTHPYISTGLKQNKFGIAFDEALSVYREAAALPNLKIVGIDCHIGSQLLDDAPLLEALARLTELVDQLSQQRIALTHIDLGGGLGIRYDAESPVLVEDYIGRVFAFIDDWRQSRYQGAPIKVMFEPGRSLVGNAGLLLTRVEYLKPGIVKNFAVVDAAMNDLMRPALYEAWHAVTPVVRRDERARLWDIVGPICESGDWLARDRSLALREDDLLVIESAGAYAMTMASNYNTRPRAAEVLVDGTIVQCVREREQVEDLFAREHLPSGD